MKETIKNYIFENELAEFYINSLDDSENVTGQITVTADGKIEATLIKLPVSFQKSLKETDEFSDSFRKIPKIWGKILKTGQPFYLHHPLLVPASHFSRLEGGGTEILENFDSFWQILEMDAALFFDYAKKNTFYMKGYAPVIPSDPLEIKSFIWNLDDFRSWLGAFVRCRYQQDIGLQKTLKKAAEESISPTENGELVFIPYEFQIETKEYTTALGHIQVSRKCSLGETNIFQTEGKIRTSGFLQINPQKNYPIREAGILYAGVESFFRTFVSRDQQIPYPEIRLDNGLHARLIVPRMKIKASPNDAAAFSFYYKNMLPFQKVKETFGYYLTRYLERSQTLQSGYSVYVKDVCKRENSEEAFFFLAASLEHLVNRLILERFSLSTLLPAIERLIECLENDISAFKECRSQRERKNALKDAKVNFEFVKTQIMTNERATLEKSVQRLYFKNRLWIAIQDLECDFSWTEIRNFTNEFVALRNYLAHQASLFEMGKGTSERMRLLPIISATRMMICAMIMKSVGFEKEMILYALQSGEFNPERNAISPACSFAGLFKFL